MSNFPHNHHKYKQSDSVNGSPLTYDQACEWAEEILMWHSSVDTDDWTQSSDAHDWDVRNMALGLMELFSDPGAVRRIMLAGETVKRTVETMVKVGHMEGVSQATKDSAKVIEKLFE